MNSMRTEIFRQTDNYERLLGFLDAADQQIYELRGQTQRPVGRIERETGRVFRLTSFDERELGTFTPDGHIRSHGLFEGGELGWVDPDGVVIQGGLILGEEEVGRVAGPDPIPAAAALLLLFLPDEQEENKRFRTE